jgi:hypothetical protein
LTSILTPTEALEGALETLVKAELIKRDGRALNVHRVVQEAMNYYSLEDLQESFDTVLQTVDEDFQLGHRTGVRLPASGFDPRTLLGGDSTQMETHKWVNRKKLGTRIPMGQTRHISRSPRLPNHLGQPR